MLVPNQSGGIDRSHTQCAEDRLRGLCPAQIAAPRQRISHHHDCPLKCSSGSGNETCCCAVGQKCVTTVHSCACESASSRFGNNFYMA